MPASQEHVDKDTPMGARLIADGATFRVWAPNAEHVCLVLGDAGAYRPKPEDPPLHALPHSAGITIPANGVLVFARDAGD
jgi:hypothetical protein